MTWQRLRTQSSIFTYSKNLVLVVHIYVPKWQHSDLITGSPKTIDMQQISDMVDKRDTVIKDSLVRDNFQIYIGKMSSKQVNPAFCIKTCQLPNVKMPSISLETQFKTKCKEHTIYSSWCSIWIILPSSKTSLALFNTQTKIRTWPIHKIDYFSLGSWSREHPEKKTEEYSNKCNMEWMQTA